LVPLVRDEVGKAAVPPLSVTVPKRVVPSRNWTLPVAVLGATIAVKVTVCPKVDGLMSTESVVVVAF
jgi:hypothetical protein